ncbi:MAG: GNAT family N-acetyltransferase [Stenotrophobium sp.]
MRDAAQLRPARMTQPAPLILRAELPSPAFNRFLYTAVGGGWHWTDRLGWSPERWMQYLDRPQLQTWVMYAQGSPAGYVELEAQDGGDVEIAYFGLLPQFIGRGLGGHLLTAAIERAWAMPGTRRVWVHTCSLDAANARANYEARGMTLYKTETAERDISPTPGQWPDTSAA